jgi:tetratricopeptide (TPR) repeat protein
VSETKETESGAEAQADSEAADAEVSKGEAESADKVEADTEAEASDEGEGTSAPKKKKKARELAAEPETIRDRNARVRAEAADKRRARREREQGGSTRRNLDASEVMDDALARSTHAAANLLTKHFGKLQWIIMAGLVGWIGLEVYSWRHARTTEKATDALFKALSAETGKVGTADEAVQGAEDRGPSDNRRAFASEEERLKAAKSEYQLASTTSSSTTAVLADLGLAGVAYDLGQYKDAQAAFEKVKQHPAFATDSDIKGRTLEGLGMALEAQKNDAGALKAFHELQNMDGANFSALGMYHQARILKGQGKNDEALKLLEKAGEKLATLKETPGAIRYLGTTVLELMESLDPAKAKDLTKKLMSTEAAKKAAESDALGGLDMLGGPGGRKLTPAELQKKIQDLLAKQKPGQAPGAPVPMPPGPIAPPQDAPQDAPPQDAPQDAPAPAPSGAQ